MACTRAKATLHSVFETNQLAAIFQLVRSSFGLTSVPAMAASHAVGCRLLPLKGSSFRRIGYLRARRHFVSRPMRQFAVWLRTHSRNSPAGTLIGTRKSAPAEPKARPFHLKCRKSDQPIRCSYREFRKVDGRNVTELAQDPGLSPWESKGRRREKMRSGHRSLLRCIDYTGRISRPRSKLLACTSVSAIRLSSGQPKRPKSSYSRGRLFSHPNFLGIAAETIAWSSIRHGSG
jgi:LysR substrate binding domain